MATPDHPASAEYLTVTVSKPDGTVLFVGAVRSDRVAFHRKIHAPSAVTLPRYIEDTMGVLRLASDDRGTV